MAVDWEERRSGWKKRDSDARSNWDVDYARVIHSASFRRLQGKTQILNLGDSDFYRTVRRQGFWNQWLRKLIESLAHLVGFIMRRGGGDASVAFRVSFV